MCELAPTPWMSSSRAALGSEEPVRQYDAAFPRTETVCEAKAAALDGQIAPLARTATQQGNATWGLLMRAGNDKSHLARQVERYSDVYTSRVSNLLYATPFAYLRSPRGSLPHDMPLPGGRPSSPGLLAGTLE
jgi:5'-nucleotidase